MNRRDFVHTSAGFSALMIYPGGTFENLISETGLSKEQDNWMVQCDPGLEAELNVPNNHN